LLQPLPVRVLLLPLPPLALLALLLPVLLPLVLPPQLRPAPGHLGLPLAGMLPSKTICLSAHASAGHRSCGARHCNQHRRRE
jgi:hypothetical protein